MYLFLKCFNTHVCSLRVLITGIFFENIEFELTDILQRPLFHKEKFKLKFFVSSFIYNPPYLYILTFYSIIIRTHPPF